MSLPVPGSRSDEIPADPVQPEQAVQVGQREQPAPQDPGTSEQAAPSNAANFDPQSAKADELLAHLLEAGFDENTATLALRRTDWKGVDEAVAWIIERSNQSDFEGDSERSDSESDEDEAEAPPAGGSAEAAPAEMNVILAALKTQRTHKMVFVANMGLKMGVGKLAAQVGHATLAVYKQAMNTEEGRAGIESWTRRGQVKIVVKGDSTEQLMDLFKEAKDKGLTAYLVQDAGYTQIPPGSRTILGVFGPKEVVDSVTGQLRLL